MVITRTPYRISFFGGGTDYKEWLAEHDGFILSTAIDKYCYIAIRPYPEYLFKFKHRVVWSHIEQVNSPEEILHPVIRDMLKYFGVRDGLEIHHQGDLPAKNGMGSSSAFTVGLAQALHYQLYGVPLNKNELAKFAILFEQDCLNETVGCQDQISSAYGGLNFIHLCKGSFGVEPIWIDTTELQKRLRLYHLGGGRMSSSVTRQLVQNIPKKTELLQKIGDFALMGLRLMDRKDWDGFGSLLGEMWECKKRLSDVVSNPDIDKLYQKCLDAGALGGKLLGAGGTGFLLMYVPPDKQDAVDNAMITCTHVPFRFEDKGCQISIPFQNE